MNAQQLRNSILQQAIQGKLVPQDPADEPASVLLQCIRKEKERLVKEGKLKKKDLESKPIEEDEIPFEIPKGWEWCIIGDLFAHNNGKQLNKGNARGKMMDYITTSNLYWEGFVLDKLKQMPFEDNEIDRCQAIKGDLLVCEGGDIGRAAIWNYDYPIMLQNHLHKLRSYVPLCTEFFRFLFYYYNKSGMIGGKGIGIQGFSSKALHNTLAPLPPLAEQRRIVAKIEELMPLVERYGKAQQALDQLNESLPARLRQSILQEAIQGRLVPQDPKEEPASELLKRILTTVNKTSTKKKILTKIKEEDMPENIVDGWEYFYIKDVFFTTSGGTPIKGHPEYYGGDIPWVKSGELNNKYLYDSEQKITEFGLKNSSAKFFPIDTVAIAMYGATIGKTSIFKKEMTTNQAICGIFPVEGILPEYIYYFLIAKKQDFCSQAFGGAQPNISQEKIKNTVFPLPTLSEQKRIVAKVEELFGVIR